MAGSTVRVLFWLAVALCAAAVLLRVKPAQIHSAVKTAAAVLLAAAALAVLRYLWLKAV